MTKIAGNPKDTRGVVKKAFAFATTQLQQGNLVHAEQMYLKVLQAVPDHVDSLFHLAIIFNKTGRRKEAITCYHNVTSIQPNHADAWNNMGNIYALTGHFSEAENAFKKALEHNPKSPEFWYNYGNVLRVIQDSEQAEESYRKALELRPDYIEAKNNLGLSLSDMGRLADAEKILSEVVKQDESLYQTWNNLGAVYQGLRNKEKAKQCYQKAIEINPESAEVFFHLAGYRTYESAEDENITFAKQKLENSSLAPHNKAYYHFALGKAYDSLGLYDEAFSHYSDGGSIRKATSPYDGVEQEKFVSRIISTFTPEFFEKHKGWGSAEESPVFIVGLPRTGKTLVENLLAAHPEIYPAGELRTIRDISRKCSEYSEADRFPEAAMQLDKTQVKSFAQVYEERLLRDVGNDISYVTDTMPYNFLYLGLIALLFPNAKIIHCTRNPVDTCLFNYFALFEHSGGHTYDLADMAEYYRQYSRLMQHWQEVLPVSMLEVAYEDMVNDGVAVVGRLNEFLDIKESSGCKNELDAIHGGELGHWKHYEKHVDKLQEMFGVSS